MKIRNKILAAFFILFLVCSAGSLWINGTVKSIWDTARETGDGMEQAVPAFAVSHVSETVNDASETLSDFLPYQIDLIELNGSVLHAAGTRSYYNEEYGINVSKDGYVVGKYNCTSTDYEVEQLLALKEYLDQKGISLLYVNEPTKYIEDEYYTGQFGGESFINRNADLFLSRIADAGVEYLDLRESIADEGLNPASLFYRTDHHWTVPASKWAAFKISEKLNNSFDYNIDLSLYDDSRFHRAEYQKAWLGEQGRLIAKTYLGLEDYTMLEPVYPTAYTVLTDEQAVRTEGDFGIFINKDMYKFHESYYTDFPWHYSYQSYENNQILNHHADCGNVLVLGDSYEASMLPFLSLGLQRVKTVCLRSFSGSIREYIDAGDYDTVIVAYAQFMIGAHDDETNANYRMFNFQ